MLLVHCVFLISLMQTIGSGAWSVDFVCPDKCNCDPHGSQVSCVEISEVPTFSEPESVKYLDLQGCSLDNLKANAFQGLVNVETLDLGNASIFSIEPKAFANLPKLLNIYLQFNEIMHLVPDIFSDLPSLRYLDLSKNKLKVFSLHTFKNLSSIIYISLSHNEISLLQPEVFDILPTLTNLVLGSNQLVSIPKNLFQKFPKLNTIHMDSNLITVIQNEDFSNSGELKNINLYNNKIHTIKDLAFSTQNRPTKIVPKNLQILTLSANNLTSVPKVLSMLSMLVRLELSGNHFTTIGMEDFGPGLQNLQYLSINYVKELTEIKRKAFQNLKSLNKFDMHSNHKLKSIPADAFHGLKNLKIVFLENNSISTFQESLLDWKSMKTFNIQYNPIKCDCSMQWISDNDGWHFTNAKNMTSRLVCASPPKFANESVVGLESTYSECGGASGKESFGDTVHSRLKTAAILSSVVFVCLVLCLVGLKYRRTLLIRWRYYRYARQNDDSLFTVENEFDDFPSRKQELQIGEYTDNEKNETNAKSVGDST